MIGPAQFVNGIWMGIVLIALGLLPGILENLTDSCGNSPAYLAGSNSIPPATQFQQVPPKQQPLLAALGAAIIAATFILYFAI